MRFICKICQTEINVRPSRKRQYCSTPCYRISKRHQIKPSNFTCLECGKDLRIRPSRVNKKYCSKKCSSKNQLSNMLGKKHSLESRIKMSKIIRPKGEFATNWQGGITPINKAIRNSMEYEEWRTKVFERDLYTCQVCEQIGGYLQADHIKPFSIFPELRFELDNGQTLCIDCHRFKTKIDISYIAKVRREYA